jgi:hypothetical protein
VKSRHKQEAVFFCSLRTSLKGFVLESLTEPTVASRTNCIDMINDYINGSDVALMSIERFRKIDLLIFLNLTFGYYVLLIFA